MIIIGLGSNLSGPGDRSPRENLEAALDMLSGRGVGIIARSSWYETEPVPPSDQPDFTNGVALVETALAPDQLMNELLALEAACGRARRQRWAARVVDLDIIDFHGLIRPGGDEWRRIGDADAGGLVLPHPRMHERRFVLQPLAEILPGWRHPVLGRTVDELLAAAD